MTWVVSPAGSGKTCLAAGFLASKRNVVWLHLDPDDSEPATFFHYLHQAARVIKSRLRLPTLLPEYRLDIETFGRRYFRELLAALPARSVLVLDNYEALAEGSELHGLLAEAVAQTPGDLAWLMLSRSEPPAAYARVRAAGQLAMLDFETLRFTLEETRQLVKVLESGARVSSERIAHLHEGHQGWAAGIVLALGSLGAADVPWERRERAGEAAVFDYFATEVFRGLGESRQRFLMQTACLPQVSGQSAQALTGEADAISILEDLVRRNYFTSWLSNGSRAGSKSRIYRYHPLFRRFLVDRARAELEADVLTGLHVRAAEILAEGGQYEPAIDLLRERGRWEELGHLVQRWGDTLLEQGRHEVLSARLADVPAALGDFARGWLLYFRAAARLPFDPREAQGDYAEAFHCFVRLRDAEGLFLSWAGVSESLLYGWGSFCDYDEWLDRLDEQLCELKPPSLAIEGRLAATAYGALLFRRPRDPAIDRWETKVRRFLSLSRLLDPHNYVLLAINVFHHDLWRGRHARAKALLDSLEGAVASKRVGPVAVLSWYTQCAVYGHFTGDGLASVKSAEAGLEYASRTGVHFWDFLLVAQGAYGAVAIDDPVLAQRYLDRLRTLVHTERHLENMLFHDIAAQIALLAGDANRAVESSALGLDAAVRLGSPYPEIALRAGYSQTLFACDRRAEARAEIERAATLARELGSTVLLARCQLASAEYALREGRRDECLRFLAEGFGSCRQHGYFGLVWWRTDVMTELSALALQAGIEPDFVRALIRRRSMVVTGRAALSPSWTWPVKVFTLRSDRSVLIDDELIGFEGKAQRRPLELLHALIALGGEQVPEARLAEALWPESEGDAAEQAVATTLHRLRRLIGAQAIVCSDHKLSLDRRLCWIDSFACEDAWVDDASAEELAEGIALYRRPFLAGSDAGWALVYRQRLAAKFVRAVNRRGQALCAADRHEAAIALYEQAVDAEPSMEALYRSLMAVCLELGRGAQAADVYRRCRDNLRLLQACEPSRETAGLLASGPARLGRVSDR